MFAAITAAFLAATDQSNSCTLTGRFGLIIFIYLFNWVFSCDFVLCNTLRLSNSQGKAAPAPAGEGGPAPVGNSAPPNQDPQSYTARNDGDDRTMVLHTLPAVESIIRVNDSAIMIVAHILMLDF